MTKLEIATLIDHLRATARHRFVQPAIDAADQLRAEHKAETQPKAEVEPAPKAKK